MFWKDWTEKFIKSCLHIFRALSLVACPLGFIWPLSAPSLTVLIALLWSSSLPGTAIFMFFMAYVASAEDTEKMTHDPLPGRTLWCCESFTMASRSLKAHLWTSQCLWSSGSGSDIWRYSWPPGCCPAACSPRCRWHCPPHVFTGPCEEHRQHSHIVSYYHIWRLDRFPILCQYKGCICLLLYCLQDRMYKALVALWIENSIHLNSVLRPLYLTVGLNFFSIISNILVNRNL